MLSVEIIRTCIQYDEAMNRRVWESVMQLSDEQFVVEVKYSLGSLRDQMVHLAGVNGRWLRGLKEMPEAGNYSPKAVDYPTRESAFALWDGVAQDFLAYVDTLDEASLLYTPRGLPGATWQVLLHVANHGTDHRAQVLRILHDLGATSFPQDLLLHLYPDLRHRKIWIPPPLNA